MAVPQETGYYSINEYTGDGSQTEFEISFEGGYISREHVKLSLIDGDTITQPSFTFVGDFTISVVPAPAVGVTVKIYRDTPIDAPLVNFSDGSVINERTLDENANQAIFAAQEIIDRLGATVDLEEILALLQALLATQPLSIQAFGGVGNGITDNTAAFQAAADSRRSIYFPRGNYLTGSFTFPTLRPPGGIRWYGEGVNFSDAFAIAGVREGAETQILYNGTDGGTMMVLDSMIGFQLENITLVGKPSSGSLITAGCLVQMKKAQSPGNGTHTFDRVAFQYADCGIRFGLDAADTNNDTTRFGHVLFYRMAVGFESLNNQALGFHFDSIFATQVGSVLHMVRGGSVSFDQANFSQCGSHPNAVTYGATSDSYCIDIQNASTGGHDFVFISLRTEGGTQQILRANIYTRVYLLDYNEPTTDRNTRQFQLTGGTMVFQSCRFVTQDDAVRPFYGRDGLGGQRSNMVFRECVFETPQQPTQPFDYLLWFDWYSRGAIQMENCSAGLANLPVPKLGTKLEWGDVYLRGITVDDTPRSLTGNGSEFTSPSNGLQLPENTAWVLDVDIMAAEFDGTHLEGNTAHFRRKSIVSCYHDGTAYESAIVDTVTVGSDVNPDTLSVAISAGDNKIISIDVEGLAATTYHWYATVKAARLQPILSEPALPPIDLEYVTNGGFETIDGIDGYGWAIQGGFGVSFVGEQLVMDSTSVGIPASAGSGFGEAAIPGVSYHVEYDIIAVTNASGGVSIQFGNTNTPAETTTGHKTADITAIAEDRYRVVKRGTPTFGGTIDNVTITRNP